MSKTATRTLGLFFFFQAEDGIRDLTVTGVQTCALPISAHTEETVYWSALLGAAELLLGGTTAILDMETVRHTGAAFQALERIGIRAAVGKCLMDAHPEGAPLELAESTDNALAEAESLAKRWHNGGNAGGQLRVCFAPRFVPSCSGPLLRAASELAERFDAQLHTHAAETIVERETVLRTTGLERSEERRVGKECRSRWSPYH